MTASIIDRLLKLETTSPDPMVRRVIGTERVEVQAHMQRMLRTRAAALTAAAIPQPNGPQERLARVTRIAMEAAEDAYRDRLREAERVLRMDT